MLHTSEVINQRLAVLIGLEVSGVNRAADMLTMQFGPLREVRNYRGAIKKLGTWALHVQCDWELTHANAGDSLVSRADFSGTDEAIIEACRKMESILTSNGPTVVQRVLGDAAGGVFVEFSRSLTLTIVSDNQPGDEDWRFFSPRSDGDHFVIECGKVLTDDQ